MLSALRPLAVKAATATPATARAAAWLGACTLGVAAADEAVARRWLVLVAGADTKLAPLKSATAPAAAAMVVLEVDAMTRKKDETC